MNDLHPAAKRCLDATDPTDNVRTALPLAARVRDPSEHGVSDGMSERVVDQFEMVDIDHKY